MFCWHLEGSCGFSGKHLGGLWAVPVMQAVLHSGAGVTG